MVCVCVCVCVRVCIIVCILFLGSTLVRPICVSTLCAMCVYHHVMNMILYGLVHLCTHVCVCVCVVDYPVSILDDIFLCLVLVVV